MFSITADKFLDSCLNNREIHYNISYTDKPISLEEVQSYADGTKVNLTERLAELICVAHERFCQAVNNEGVGYEIAWRDCIVYPLNFIDLEIFDDMYFKVDTGN